MAAEPAEATPPVPAPGEGVEPIMTEDVLPEGYPTDVPIYPNSEPGPAMAVPGLGMFATFHSSDPQEKILEHFRSALAENGWSVDDSPVDGFNSAKEERTVEIRVRPGDEGGNDILVNINEG